MPKRPRDATELLLEAEECIVGGLPLPKWRKLAKEIEAWILKQSRPGGEVRDLLIHAQMVLAWGSQKVKSLPHGGMNRWLARWRASSIRAEIEKRILKGET